MSIGVETIVVTGAAGGMGAALCRILKDRGHAVLPIDQRSTGLANELVCDLTDRDLPTRLSARLNALPSVSGLANVAGVSIGSGLLDSSTEEWNRMIETNLTAPMTLAKCLIPKMIDRGGGAIVNVGSPVGFTGARKPGYAASKAGLIGLTMTIARQFGKAGIRCNLLLPGATITDMTGNWDQTKRDRIARTSFFGRLCCADDIAEVMAFMLSDASRCITGAVIDATAGQMLGAH